MWATSKAPEFFQKRLGGSDARTRPLFSAMSQDFFLIGNFQCDGRSCGRRAHEGGEVERSAIGWQSVYSSRSGLNRALFREVGA